jgi:hypothetical protein
VGHGSATSLLHREAGLGAIEGLDLTLLVHNTRPETCPEDSDTDPPRPAISR